MTYFSVDVCNFFTLRKVSHLLVHLYHCMVFTAEQRRVIIVVHANV